MAFKTKGRNIYTFYGNDGRGFSVRANNPQAAERKALAIIRGGKVGSDGKIRGARGVSGGSDKTG